MDSMIWFCSWKQEKMCDVAQHAQQNTMSTYLDEDMMAAYALCKMSREALQVKQCQICGTTKTPLWRRNQHYSTMCNACGLWMKTHV
jgi:hypothetical protein